MQEDTVFWTQCSQLWGKGGGFRAQVARRVKKWFEEHQKVTDRLDDRLKDLWSETFIDWMRSYLAENADTTPAA